MYNTESKSQHAFRFFGVVYSCRLWYKERLEDREVSGLLKRLRTYVPYCFQSPWLGSGSNERVMELSQRWTNGCLYALHKDKDGMYIVLNSDWDGYLHENYRILEDFVYWNLTLFVQSKNPNVPNVANKLIKPTSRNSLTKQHRCWDIVLKTGRPLRCIYTGRTLNVGDYDLDHFVPWSFVSHDLMWNLVPADGSINSSKSNNLPDLDVYLPKMVGMQHRLLEVMVKRGKENMINDDYLSLGYSVTELLMMDETHLLDLYKKTFNP